MSEYGDKAGKYFKEGYNCSQAVLMTFAEEIGMDRDTALRLASSFGGGMGRLREVCGAVSAIFMVAGLKYGYTSPTDKAAKTEQYTLIRKLAEEFKAEYGTIICRELLGEEGAPAQAVPDERSASYYASRPCEGIVRYAADIAARILNIGE